MPEYTVITRFRSLRFTAENVAVLLGVAMALMGTCLMRPELWSRKVIFWFMRLSRLNRKRSSKRMLMG